VTSAALLSEIQETSAEAGGRSRLPLRAGLRRAAPTSRPRSSSETVPRHEPERTLAVVAASPPEDVLRGGRPRAVLIVRCSYGPSPRTDVLDDRLGFGDAVGALVLLGAGGLAARTGDHRVGGSKRRPRASQAFSSSSRFRAKRGSVRASRRVPSRPRRRPRRVRPEIPQHPAPHDIAPAPKCSGDWPFHRASECILSIGFLNGEALSRRKPPISGGSHGASRTRTGDLLGAIQALSQLSYSPAVVKCSEG
jgi:hypothetical protein